MFGSVIYIILFLSEARDPIPLSDTGFLVVIFLDLVGCRGEGGLQCLWIYLLHSNNHCLLHEQFLWSIVLIFPS